MCIRDSLKTGKRIDGRDLDTVRDIDVKIDILNNVSNHNSLRPKLVIGFAAETMNLELNAKNKLTEKNCDWIIANDISKKDIGFESDENSVSIFYKNQDFEEIKKTSKSNLADKIVERIINHLN